MPVLALLALVVATQPSLAKIALKPSQVGPGYVLQQRPDGAGTAQRTMDLCGTTGYASESLRVERLQVNYLRQNAPLALSNEIVRYTRDGAAEAMREAARHAADCPKKPIAFEGFPPLRYDVTRITDSKLVKGYLAAKIHRYGTVKGKKVDDTFIVVYQRYGDVLSGVYSYAAKGVSVGQQEAFCLHAAEASARNLLAGAAPSGVPA